MGQAIKLTIATGYLLIFLTSAAGQTPQTARPLGIREARYSVRAGEPVAISAPNETLEFLLKAKTRQASIDGKMTGGLTVGPNRAGDGLLLAASRRIKPGSHTVTISAADSNGETRQSSFTADVGEARHATAGSNRAPVVLVNGWIEGFTGACTVATSSSETFGNLAAYLVSDGVPDVFLFDNCVEDPGQPVEQLGNDLQAYLNSITDSAGNPILNIDVVAHSVGGLIVRSYLAGLQPITEVLTPPLTPQIGKLVLIASPNFGSFVAGNNIQQLPVGTQDEELVPASSLLWNLATWNQRGDDLRGVNAIAVIGNAGSYNPAFASNTVLANASDGLVTLTSASLSFVAQQPAVTRIVPYCHVDPSAFTNTQLGTFFCNAAGIANVTSTNHPTGQIVRSFLSGSSDWMSIGTTPATDTYLKSDGGTYFALQSATDVYATDITQASYGSLQLQNGGDTGTVFYDDFVSGTGNFTVTSTALGSFNCGSLKQAAGYFAATRCKVAAAIFNVTPLASLPGRVVQAGGMITISGADLGSQCNGCNVVAAFTGATTGQTLQISSWTATAIQATLPATFTGLLTITVHASTGTDSITIVASAASATVPTISAAPATLQFTAAAGGSAPAAQSVQLTNSGAGTLTWTATPSDAWLTVTAGSGTAPSMISVAVAPGSLAAGTYQGTIQIAAAGASNTPLSIAVTLTLTAASTGSAPVISSVTSAASFQPGLAPAGWVSIFGTNLAQTTYLWQAADFVNGQMPTALSGVSVTIGGVAAYVEYVSPTQINVLAPDTTVAAGPVQVQVTSGGQSSSAFAVTEAALAPAFFTIDGGAYVTAVHADATLVGAVNLLPGVTSRPAAPGEVIVLYGTGFGPTNPATPTGQLVNTAYPLAGSVSVTIGGVAAPVVFAGVVESGLYQFNVTVPALGSGDAPVIATIGGLATRTGLSLPIQ